jgi:hypothetical protein
MDRIWRAGMQGTPRMGSPVSGDNRDALVRLLGLPRALHHVSDEHLEELSCRRPEPRGRTVDDCQLLDDWISELNTVQTVELEDLKHSPAGDGVANATLGEFKSYTEILRVDDRTYGQAATLGGIIERTPRRVGEGPSCVVENKIGLAEFLDGFQFSRP